MGNVLTALAVVLLAASALLHDRRIKKLENQVDQLVELLCIVEFRCPDCADRKECPAADTGVSFPCEHFMKEDQDGKQE